MNNAQIITSDSSTETFQGGIPQPTPGNFVNNPGLDISFFYLVQEGRPTGSSTDSPFVSIGSTGLVDITQSSFVATMYLMWTSNKAGSIPIPVESVDWSWFAEATFNPTTGEGKIIPSKSSVAKKISGQAYNSGVLTWKRVQTNP